MTVSLILIILPVEADMRRCAERCCSALTRASRTSTEETVDPNLSLLFMPMGTAIAIWHKLMHDII